MASQLFLPYASPIVNKSGFASEAMQAWMRLITQAVPASGAVSSVTATSPIVSSGGTTPNISHANSGVSAGTYGDSTHVAQVTVDATGHVTTATSVAIAATGTVTTTGTPANGNLTKFSGATSITNGDLSGDVTTSGTLVTTLANSGVTAGSYTNASITVDAKGRVTAASSGSSTDYVVMSDGANPPTPVDDGAGNFVYVGYTP